MAIFSIDQAQPSFAMTVPITHTLPTYSGLEFLLKQNNLHTQIKTRNLHVQARMNQSFY